MSFITFLRFKTKILSFVFDCSVPVAKEKMKSTWFSMLIFRLLNYWAVHCSVSQQRSVPDVSVMKKCKNWRKNLKTSILNLQKAFFRENNDAKIGKVVLSGTTRTKSRNLSYIRNNLAKQCRYLFNLTNLRHDTWKSILRNWNEMNYM